MIRNLPLHPFGSFTQVLAASETPTTEVEQAIFLRHSDLLQLGQEALRHGEMETAADYFSQAAPHMPCAELGLQALRGEFNIWQVESLAEQFVDLAMDPAPLGAMFLAARTFQFTRALGQFHLMKLGLGRAVTPLSFTLAFATEAATFPLHHHALDGLMGRQVSWESQELQHEVRGSFLTLGALRLFSAGATSLYRRFGAAPNWHSLFEQGGMALGILSSRALETVLAEPEFRVDLRSWWLQSAVTWLHFNVAGRVLHQSRVALGRPTLLRESLQRPPAHLRWAWASQSFAPSNFARRPRQHPSTPHYSFTIGHARAFLELSRSEQYDAMAGALEQTDGAVRAAAAFLDISVRTFRNRLKQAERDQSEALQAWVEFFSPAGQQARREAEWVEMDQALTASAGQLKGAAKLLGIAESTLHYRLSLARQSAPVSSPIGRWAERLSTQGQRRTRSKQFAEIARALTSHEGNILAAARELGVSPTVIYHGLRAVADGAFPRSPLKFWVERFTEQGKRRTRRRRWMEYTRALIEGVGDIKQTSQKLGITQGTYSRFLSEITSIEGTDTIDPYYRRIILCTLARSRPTDRRLLQLLREGNHDPFRLAALQSLTSEARVVRKTLSDLLAQDPSPLIRIAAEYSLNRNRGDRVIWLLGTAGRRLNFSQLLRGTGMLSRQLTELLAQHQTSGQIFVNEAQQYSLSPAGLNRFHSLRNPFRWDLLNGALEQTQGHRRQAAARLGMSHETMNKQLQASLGRNGDPLAVAPEGHLLHRWGDELFVARISRAKSRASRIERYRGRWELIQQALAEHGEDFSETALALGLRETRLAALIRLAVAYDWEPLRPFADPQRWRDHRSQKQEEQWRALRAQNRQWYVANSKHQHLSLRQLPLAQPLKQSSQEVRVELALRYQMGQRDAGDLLIRIYEPWIRGLSRGKSRPGISLRDLDQAGREGLLEAAERFDPARGNQLSTYAYWYILKNQVDLLRSHLAMDVSPRDYQLYQQVQQLQWEASQRGERLSDGDLMEALQLDAGRLQEVLQVGSGAYAQSLDQARGEEGVQTLHDQTVGSTADGFRGQLAQRFRQTLNGFFQSHGQRGHPPWTPEMLMVDREEIIDLAQRVGATPKQYLKSRQQMLGALREYLASYGIGSGFFE